MTPAETSPSAEASQELEVNDTPYADPAETFAPEASFADQPTEESVEVNQVEESFEFSQRPASRDEYTDTTVEELSAQPEADVHAQPQHSLEELFGAAHVSIDTENETVDSFSPFESKVSDDVPAEMQSEELSCASEDYEIHDTFVAARHEDTATTQSGSTCPFCGSANDPQAFDCGACNARLTLSDIEALLTEREVNRDFLQAAVTQMEAEWNLREFNETEMTALGLGHLNLGNFITS